MSQPKKEIRCSCKSVTPKSRNILELSEEEKLKFLNSFDVIFADCDGTIWMLAGPIPRSGDGLALLQQAGKQINFISNNSMRSDEEYIERLTSLGIKDVTEKNLIHPVKPITRYLKRNMNGQPIFSLCGEKVNAAFKKNGIDIRTMKPRLDLDIEDLESYIKPDDEVAAVIIDLNFNITYGELARAYHYLLSPNCPLLVAAPDDWVPVSSQFKTIGTGGFIRILETYSNKKPIYLGKPGEQLCEYLKEVFNVKEPKRVLFIGDNLQMDIGFGLSCDFQTLLVLTGASTYEQMEEMPNKLKPDYYAQSLADFVEFFKELN